MVNNADDDDDDDDEKQVTWHTWFCITSSDDFKLCDRITTWNPLTMPVMHPAFPVITPLNSHTSGVSNTCIKTLLQGCWRSDPPSAFCTHVGIDDPARWTADNWRRYCCRTEHGLTVIWVTSTINIHTNIMLFTTRLALCRKSFFSDASVLFCFVRRPNYTTVFQKIYSF